MSETLGILSYGVYLPRNRLQRAAIYKAHAWFAPQLKTLAKGERAAANWDEDSITMGVEAARDALAQVDRSQIASLCLALTTLPFADRLNAGVVKEALNLPDEVRALDITGGQRAGTSALIEMLEGKGSAQGPSLCIAAEMRKVRAGSEAEMTYGDAGAAFVIGKGEPCAKFLAARSVTVDFVDHFRASGVETDYFWESRWIRDEGYTRLLGDALQSALASFGVAAADIAHAVIAIPAPAAVQGLAKKIGLRPESLGDTFASSTGETGVTHPLLLLAATLDHAKAGQRILVVSFGQGVDILLLEATPALERVPIQAFNEASADAGIEVSQIDAAWLGAAFDAVNIGPSGIPLATGLRLRNIGVTKVENYCASGTEAFRGAVYAVASGAADIALALGMEKLKDTGYDGLPIRTRGTTFDMMGVTGSAPGNLAQLASAYCADGFYDADGPLPCQIDGGLKCFGHPIGASGLRMIYENYLQLLGRAAARQRRKPPSQALSHNLGGMPSQNVAAIAIVGLADV